jgi:leader peptidase (prepilin peptidase)/N-methyltransferase
MTDVSMWTAAVAGGFVAGCMVGSFLNVVAHRVPRRETVVFGRSHCPACGATIRPRDNVPVLGWIALGGRCRDCRTRISPRYPLVEAACGGLVAALAAAELAAGDRPALAVTSWIGHAAVALTLVAWALLAERGHMVSDITVGTAWVAALLAAGFVPALAPLPVGCAGGACRPGWPASVVASLAGLGTGWLAGCGVGGRAGAACGLVGAALGWQAALVAALAAGSARAAWPRAAAAPVAAVLAVACWHPITWAWAGVCRAAGAG